MLQQGTLLNNTYTLLEELGSGGGGIVYKAYHERLQKYVVVKQIKDQVKGILQGRAEADILKKLKHTNLPQVYDFLEIDGEIYTVMDFVPGESLDKALERKETFDAKTVYQWALQLADALAYLHRQNPPVIHSDIKPANVMLTPGGDICLIDFNISLAFDEGRRTSTGISKGYSPPEQHHNFQDYVNQIQRIRNSEAMVSVRKTRMLTKQNNDAESNDRATVLMDGGFTEECRETAVLNWDASAEDAEETVALNRDVLAERKNHHETSKYQTQSTVSDIIGKGVDERSDVYSLGATLYHLLTGVRPTEDFDSIRQIGEFPIKLGEGFRVIIEKMMELDPAKRYQNGSELLYALQHVYELDGEYKSFKRRRRNLKLLTVILYAAGISVMGSGWITMGKEQLTAYNRAVEQADTYIENAQYAEAKNTLLEAEKLLPDYITAYEKEELLLYSMGDYEGAISYGRDAINNPVYTVKGPEDETTLGNIFYILGNAYFEREDYSDAINCFKEAIERNSENSLYFRDYAIALAKMGQADTAEEALETAIDLGLGEDSIYMVQGEIAYSRGEDALAAERLLTAVRVSESVELRRRATLLCVQAYQQMGDEYLIQEIELLRNSINSFGVDVSMHLKEQLADAYARKARISEENSAEYYSESLKIFQELYKDGYATRQMMENIGILYQQMDQMEEAEEILNQITEQYPKDYRAYKRLAFLEADKQQKKENSERDYKKMKEIYDEAVSLYQDSQTEGDTEMQMLEHMIKELKDGGWI